jgi:protein gp37
MDIADDHPTILREWYPEIVEIVQRNTNLDFLFLTGRIRNFKRIYTPLFGEKLPLNLWVGVSISSQADSEEALVELATVDAAVRFISCEPMLGPVNLRRWLPPMVTGLRPTLDWVINGAESGMERRPYNPTWSAELWEQCRDANVPFFMKQGSAFGPGNQGEIPEWLWKVREFPTPRQKSIYQQEFNFHILREK